MKKRLLCFILAALLLITPALAYGDGTGEAVYRHSTELAPGFTYENAVSYTGGKRVETFTLQLASDSRIRPIVIACDTIFGGMTATQAAAWAESLGYNVCAIMNADFGYWETRIPCGMVVEDGIYKSSPEGNNAVGWRDGRAVVAEWPKVYITLENLDNDTSCELEHLNKTRADDGLYLYSEHFSTVSTRTSSAGWYVRFEIEDGELGLDSELELSVKDVIRGERAVRIGEGNLVLTASDAAGLLDVYKSFAPGDRVILRTECSDERLAGCEWVTGCGNILALDGELHREANWDASINGIHPRTAMGIKPDGTALYQVMDGRSSASRGSTMKELALDLMSQGCDTVVNLDGGGSSILKLRLPGKSGLVTVNSPSDGAERSVCSYIVFVTEKPADNRAQRLFLGEDGAYILAGSSVELTPLANDRALHNAAAPSVSATALRGHVEDGLYTAPKSAVTDNLRLSGGVLSGSAQLFVVDRADELIVSADEAANVQKLILEPGSSVHIGASARLYMRPVYMDANAVKYSVEGKIGSIAPDGSFKAANNAGAEGKIIIEAAGLKRELPVRIAFEFDDMREHWAREPVKRLYEAGIVGGVTERSFAPNNTMRRCDFLLMLYRAAGEPAVADKTGFTDVPDNAYYADAVYWAKSSGVTEGKGEGIFAPTESLTRQEGFAFLYRSLKSLGVTTSAAADEAVLDKFPDSAAVSDWARTPAAALIAMGIVEGSDNGLKPQQTLTRAEMAKMLDKAIQLKSIT